MAENEQKKSESLFTKFGRMLLEKSGFNFSAPPPQVDFIPPESISEKKENAAVDYARAIRELNDLPAKKLVDIYETDKYYTKASFSDPSLSFEKPSTLTLEDLPKRRYPELDTLLLKMGDIARTVGVDMPRPAPDAVKIGAPTLTPADWTNPAMRVEIPASFPDIISTYNQASEIKAALDTELRKHGTSMQEVDRIVVAYPHKHSGLFPGHEDAAESVMRTFISSMERAAPGVQWISAEALVETKRLGRSENQTSVHALTAQQDYQMYEKDAAAPSKFAGIGGDRKEFFVVVDWVVEQGTTVANLVSYIHHNGGAVLGVASSGHSFAQKQQEALPPLEGAFADPTRNTARLPELAQAFAKSAARDGLNVAPQVAVQQFEDGLNKVGNSVFALTDGEVKRIIDTVNGSYWGSKASFNDMLGGITQAAADALATAPAIKAYLPAVVEPATGLTIAMPQATPRAAGQSM